MVFALNKIDLPESGDLESDVLELYRIILHKGYKGLYGNYIDMTYGDKGTV